MGQFAAKRKKGHSETKWLVVFLRNKFDCNYAKYCFFFLFNKLQTENDKIGEQLNFELLLVYVIVVRIISIFFFWFSIRNDICLSNSKLSWTNCLKTKHFSNTDLEINDLSTGNTMETHHKYFELKSIVKMFEMATELNLFTKSMYEPVLAELIGCTIQMKNNYF